MINYWDNYFKLKLLPISEILLHETTENKRLERVFERIKQDKFLMNPIIVGEYNNNYILLDGANRYTSLKSLGCKLILAQIIDYKDKKIKLERWNHVVYNFKLDILKNYCNKKNLKYECVPLICRETVMDNKFYHVLASDFINDESMIIHLSNDFKIFLDQLLEITKIYINDFEFDRSEDEIKIKDLKTYTRKEGVLIKYPKFTKEQIVDLAVKGLRVPAGITRHIIYNRVLHLKYPIDKLFTEDRYDEKSQELNEYLKLKIDSNKVRQYNESVIIFDE